MHYFFIFVDQSLTILIGNSTNAWSFNRYKYLLTDGPFLIDTKQTAYVIGNQVKIESNDGSISLCDIHVFAGINRPILTLSPMYYDYGPVFKFFFADRPRNIICSFSKVDVDTIATIVAW